LVGPAGLPGERVKRFIVATPEDGSRSADEVIGWC